MKKNCLLSLAIFIALFGISGASTPARADAFARPSMDNLLKTLIRFGALDIRYDDVVDLYGSIMVCDLYREYYDYDFKWERARQAIRADIRNNVAFFPTSYRYDAVMQLGRYDFRDRVYRFSHKTAQFSTNLFKLKTGKEDLCYKKGGVSLPHDFKIVLDKPVEILGLPMTPEDGETLVARMEKSDNKDRLVYVRFNIDILYISPFVKQHVKTTQEEKLDFRRGILREDLDASDDIRMDGRLDSIEYYEDADRKKMIYKFVP